MMLSGDTMAELNHNGHRERLRKMYLSGSMEDASEHNLLELFLTTIIPRKDVKPIAYDLINTFGSLEGVLCASPRELMFVDGIGEQSAIAISLIRVLMSKVNTLESNKKKKLKGYKDVCSYCYDFFKYEKVEKLMLITLDNTNSIISRHIVDSGSANELNVPMSKIIRIINLDGASSVILAHNHPHGSSKPSAADISYTIELNGILKKLGVHLLDHVVLGEDGSSSVLTAMKKSIY